MIKPHQVQLYPEYEGEEIAAEHDELLTVLELRIVQMGQVLDGHHVEDEDDQAQHDLAELQEEARVDRALASYLKVK